MTTTLGLRLCAESCVGGFNSGLDIIHDRARDGTENMTMWSDIDIGISSFLRSFDFTILWT